MGIMGKNCVHIKIATIETHKMYRYMYACINTLNRQISYEIDNNFISKY